MYFAEQLENNHNSPILAKHYLQDGEHIGLAADCSSALGQIYNANTLVSFGVVNRNQLGMIIEPSHTIRP